MPHPQVARPTSPMRPGPHRVLGVLGMAALLLAALAVMASRAQSAPERRGFDPASLEAALARHRAVFLEFEAPW